MTEEKENSEGFEKEFEDFVRDNREMLEKILDKVKEKDCREEVSDLRDRAKDRLNRKTKEFFLFVTDQEMQTHFMTAGFQFMMGVNAAIRAMPLPDFVKEAMESAEEARAKTADNMCRSNPDCRYKPKRKPGQRAERIEISDSEDEPQEREKPKTGTRPGRRAERIEVKSSEDSPEEQEKPKTGTRSGTPRTRKKPAEE